VFKKVIESIYNKQGNPFSQKNPYIKFSKILTNNIRKSKENTKFHYDIGNNFYRLWLDETMTYSCAYFKSPEDSLTQAQHNKVDHILRKLKLQPGQTLLDIGCGWGELILTAAKTYQVKALGITLSSEQYTRVLERIQNEGLQDLVKVQILDYRELRGRTFDRVVSVGMVESRWKRTLGGIFFGSLKTS